MTRSAQCRHLAWLVTSVFVLAGCNHTPLTGGPRLDRARCDHWADVQAASVADPADPADDAARAELREGIAVGCRRGEVEPGDLRCLRHANTEDEALRCFAPTAPAPSRAECEAYADAWLRLEDPVAPTTEPAADIEAAPGVDRSAPGVGDSTPSREARGERASAGDAPDDADDRPRRRVILDDTPAPSSARRDELVADCVRGEITRRRYECAVQASTLAEARACAAWYERGAHSQP